MSVTLIFNHFHTDQNNSSKNTSHNFHIGETVAIHPSKMAATIVGSNLTVNNKICASIFFMRKYKVIQEMTHEINSSLDRMNN